MHAIPGMTVAEEIRKDRESGARRLESEYKAGLMTLARQFCTDEGDAEELVNRTFSAVVECIDEYAEQSAFFGWMCRILSNIRSKDLRRKSRLVEQSDSDAVSAAADPDASLRLYRDVDAGLLRDEIEALPPEMKETIVLHYLLGQPIPKIAKVLSLPVGTVKSRLHYARLTLAEKLGAKAKEAAKKPGAKALLLVLAACAATALGAVAWRAVTGASAAAASAAAETRTGATGATGERTGATGATGACPASPARPARPSIPDFSTPPTPSGDTMSLSQTTRAVALAALSVATSAALPFAAAPASAAVTYDAGAAFNAAGHNAGAFGPWSLLHASDADLTATAPFGTYAKADSSLLGISRNPNGTSPWICVNTGDNPLSMSGETILPEELVVHPASPDGENPAVAVRFIAPESGWYSAILFAHDVDKRDATAVAADGARVTIRAGGTVLAQQVVSLEDYASGSSSHGFDFQVPARQMAAGDTIDVVIDPNGNSHANDATGIRFVVTKETEGAFYDSGVSLSNNLNGDWIRNPYGTLQDGTWCYLTAPVPAGAAFPAWAPTNFSTVSSAFANQYMRADGSGFSGVSGNVPWVVLRPNGELLAHPAAPGCGWTAIRFRPPVSGYYSGSIVVRDTAKGGSEQDGVRAWLNIADRVVTNAVVSLETFSATARLSFGPRLLVAGEPVDVLLSPCESYENDSTAVSTVFRRESDVFDAGKSFYDRHVAGDHAHPFPDSLGAGATWDLGAKTNALSGDQFYSLPAFKTLDGSKLSWWVHSSNSSQENGALPRICMATNAIVSWDKYYVSESAGTPILRIMPLEFFVHPNTQGYQSSSPTLRARVPSDGVYAARGAVRDLNESTAWATDGIRASIAVSGAVPSSRRMSRDSEKAAGNVYDGIVAGDRLWLKAGESIYFVVDPLQKIENDGTGLAACYARTGDATAGVLNIDIGADATLSQFAGRGREGFSDSTTWNALPVGGGRCSSIRDLRDACDTNNTSVAVSLSRDSGAAVSLGTASSGNALLDTWAASSGSGDAYSFTISGLAKNSSYTLYLYSAKGAASGNAVFTVNGVSKTPDEAWFLADGTAVAARFEVETDAERTISGTFASADSGDAAFNGFSLVGELPTLWPFVMVVR